MYQKYVFSLKHKDKCLFSRRLGFRGLLIGNYSLYIKLFGIEIL